MALIIPVLVTPPVTVVPLKRTPEPRLSAPVASALIVPVLVKPPETPLKKIATPSAKALLLPLIAPVVEDTAGDRGSIELEGLSFLLLIVPVFAMRPVIVVKL